MPETIEGVPMGAQSKVTIETSPSISKEEFEAVVDSVQKEKETLMEQFEQAKKDLFERKEIKLLPPGLSVTDNPPTLQDELDAIKDQVNQALATVIEMVVGLEERFDALDSRIQEFNRRGGHKL